MAEINNGGAADGITQDSVIQSFSETNRAELSNRGITSEQNIIDALKAADQYKGVDLSKMVAVPQEDAKAEDLMAFYGKLGRPEKAEDYGIKAPEGDNGEFLKGVLPVLHASGITKAQAQLLANNWNNMVSNQNKAANEAYEKSMAELKTEWGDQYENNINEAKRAAAELQIPKEDLVKLEKGITGSKGLWKMFYNISKRTTDSSIKGGSPDAKGGAVNLANPQEAANKLKELMKSKDFGRKIIEKDPEAIKMFNDLQAARFGDRK